MVLEILDERLLLLLPVNVALSESEAVLLPEPVPEALRLKELVVLLVTLGDREIL